MTIRVIPIILTLLLAFTPALPSLAAEDDTSASLNMLLFYSDTCPHCMEQKPFLERMDAQHAGLTLHTYNLNKSRENVDLFIKTANRHGIQAQSVPTLFMGGRAWVGDSPMIHQQLTQHLQTCLSEGNCPDSRNLSRQNPPTDAAEPAPAEVDLPLLGTVNLNMQPMVFSTAIVAFIDGFNPCSLWVLTILLALVIHSGSRKRILYVGLTFLTVTATIYGLFIAGVFGALNLMSFVGWLYPLVALFALVFALVNIKDYFFFGRGVSFIIDDKHKPGIYKRIRGLIAETQSVPALVAATAVMAAGIAIIELPCTAGFPVIWSGMVASHDVALLPFLLLLALYLLIYLSIELVIFFIALRTMRVDRFQESHGRILKLMGGVIMLALALVLMFAPDLMRTFAGALGVFAVAFAVTGFVLFLHRIVLPKMGIRIGDEQIAAKKQNHTLKK